jgi:hypothetical protein
MAFCFQKTIERQEAIMKKLTNVVPVRNTKPNELPQARATIYKNHNLKKFPKLIYKIPGVGVVWDNNEWASMCEKAKAEQVKSSERIHRPLDEA